mgnify:CR=1 FL=1
MQWDSRAVGFVLGLLAPLLGFAAYGGIYVTAIRPHHDFHWFVHDLFLGTEEYRTRIVSLSLIADAALFFLFDRRDMHKAMRGVIGAMLVYGIYIAGALALDGLQSLDWS